jgi:hypothetical protein
MKRVKIYFALFIFLAQTQVLADDKRVADTTIYNEISSEYIEIAAPAVQSAQEASGLIIIDDMGNVIREAEISSFDFSNTPAIFNPLINKCDFLTEINGVLYFRWQ